MATSSSGSPRPSPGFFPSSRLHNHTTTMGHPSSMLAIGHDAYTRPSLIPNLPSNGIPAFGNSYASNTPLFGGPQGGLQRPIWQEEIDNPTLVQSELETQRQKPPGKLLPHVEVVHTPETYARILRLSKREQAIVLIDGGNTVESQLLVLDTIEQYPADSNNKHVWDEIPTLLPSGKRTTDYRCKAPGCGYHDKKLQKARQHFVSCHVPEACWGCPIEGCPHIGKYKRLDDLKHHHMVSAHGVEYTRTRKRDASEFPTSSLTPGQAMPHPTGITPPRIDDQAPTVAAVSNPRQLLNQGPTSPHISSQAERGPKKMRVARVKASIGPSQVPRGRIARARVTSDNTPGRSHAMPVAAEASSLNRFHQDTNSLGLAVPGPVHTNAPSPHSNSQQMSPWSNYPGSPTHLGTAPTEKTFSLDDLNFIYPQATDTPLGPSLDSTSVYMPQMRAHSELSIPNAPQQASYGNPSMSYVSPPLRTQPDLAPNYRNPTLSPQGAVDVGGYLRGQVADGARVSSQGMSSDQINHALGIPFFGAGLHPTSPGAQLLTPGHSHNQWEQAGGLLTNYSYNQFHPSSSPTNMSPTQSSSGYITPSQPPSHSLGTLSSDGRFQTVSSASYAQSQRVAGPTHSFAENGGYLSVRTFPSSHGVDVLSPTQGTMYQDRFGSQTSQESMMMYLAATFDGLETPNPNFGWSPQSEYPQPTLSSNLQSNFSSNSHLQGTSLPSNRSSSESNIHFYM